MPKEKPAKEKGGSAKGKKQEAKQEKQPKRGPSIRTPLMLGILLLIIFAIFIFVVLPTLSVPFSTFKSNFASAKRIAVFAVYSNISQSGGVLGCATQVVQFAAHSRNATSIDFYVLNESRCTYPIGGLGHTVTLATNTIGDCLNMTSSETSIFLNYSAYNNTFVTPYKLYVYGNMQYMSECPIAVDLS